MRGERHPNYFGRGSETFFFSDADGILMFPHEGGSENDGEGYGMVCMVITHRRVWINRVRLPTLLVVS